MNKIYYYIGDTLIVDNGTYDFIIFQSTNLENLIFKSYITLDNKIFLVYKFNNKIKNFSTIGDVIINKQKNMYTILLVNDRLSSNPYNYVLEYSNNDTKIWRPLYNKNYIHLGLIISKNKPLSKDMSVVNTKYLNIIKGGDRNNLVLNKYNTINNENIKYCIENRLDNDTNYSDSLLSNLSTPSYLLTTSIDLCNNKVCLVNNIPWWNKSNQIKYNINNNNYKNIIILIIATLMIIYFIYICQMKSIY